jgi:23S rRNA (cytidine2498-2'-O)-methyltransferase
LFPPGTGTIRDAEDQDSRRATLFAMVGEEGLFCGVSTPLAANGFHPGGIRFIKQNDSTTISRAGAKIAGALHHLLLHQPLPQPGAHWLELGASPGGMTAELLNRGYHVTAVDRAPLDPRLEEYGNGNRANRLRFVAGDAGDYHPPPGATFDAILCDMNGDARTAMRTICRLARNLTRNGVVIFTLKMPDAESFGEITALADEVKQIARAGGLADIALTHLPYNRHEFTLILQPMKESSGPY